MTSANVPRRRVWFAGDPEPEVNARVLIAGQVWMRHHQLRWILAPGGNGALGIEWHRLCDDPDFPAVEIFPHEQVKAYGRLVRAEAPTQPEPSAPPAPAQPEPTTLWAAYRDQGHTAERPQDQRCHVATSDDTAFCDGSLLDEGGMRPAAEIPDHVRCKKRGCKVRWPS